MAARQVVNEPEFEETEEVKESEGVGEDLDVNLGAAAPPVAAKRGRGRKKKSGKKNTVPVDQLNVDDDIDSKAWTEMMNNAVRGLEECAHKYLPSVQGKEHKAERREGLKKLHEVSVQVVEARMKLEKMPGVVQKVFEDMDLERKAKELEDDEAFLAMLDEFEEESMAEIGKMGEGITYEDAISKDEKYQGCLEVLNSYQKIGCSKEHDGDDDEDVKPDVSDGAAPSTRYSEGVEVKQEVKQEIKEEVGE